MAYSVQEEWNEEVLLRRAGSSENLEGMSPGAPLLELDQYSALSSESATGSVLIMGMTVSIRRLALTKYNRVVSMDINEAAHSLLGPAVDGDEKVLGNWFDLPEALDTTFDVIWGDGIFSTMQSQEDAKKLLISIRNTLSPNGTAIIRLVMIPERIDPKKSYSEKLLAQLRSGEIDDSEFSFAMRIFGYLDESYDIENKILDCGVSFRNSRQKVADGEMTEAELKAMDRTYYTGKNFIPQKHEWEAMCNDVGFTTEHAPLIGKDWFDFYTMYKLQPQA